MFLNIVRHPFIMTEKEDSEDKEAMDSIPPPKEEDKPIKEEVTQKSRQKSVDEDIDSFNSLRLTNNALIQEFEGLGYDEYTELPLNKIDSMSYTKRINIPLIIFGVLIIAIGLIIMFDSEEPYSIYIILFGLALIAIAYFTRREVIEFKAQTSTIFEDARDSQDFVQEVRDQIYKNRKE